MRSAKKLFFVLAVFGLFLASAPQSAEAGIFGRFRRSRPATSSNAPKYLGQGRYLVNGRVLLGSGVDYPFGPRYRIGGIPVNR